MMNPWELVEWVAVWCLISLMITFALAFIVCMFTPADDEVEPDTLDGDSHATALAESYRYDLDGARQEIRYLKHYCDEEQVEAAYEAYIAGELGDES